MERQIYTIYATQVVTSAQHPEGIKSNIDGYPKDFDSRSYGASEQNPNGNSEIALIVAEADFSDRIKTLTLANNANRVMWAVTLVQADGQSLLRKSSGGFPDMTPTNTEPTEPTE